MTNERWFKTPLYLDVVPPGRTSKDWKAATTKGETPHTNDIRRRRQ